MNLIDETNKKMNSVIEHLKNELRALRTSRASSSMLDKVTVEVYGSRMRLQDLASVSTPEPRQLLVSPYDAQNVHAIVKGIEAANLNLRPIVDGNIVRITIPEMDASVRSEIVKVAHRKCEEAKVAIRNARRDGNEGLKKQKSAGEIPEDMMKQGEKKIQDLTDKCCKMADDLTREKEKEILTI